jgi:4-hydroxy-tetrahydrodipicolinate reductase
LSEILGAQSLEGEPPVSPSLSIGAEAQVALHCTGSSLERVAPQILELVEAGLNVISTTEELSYPWQTRPVIADRIDRAARARGVSVLGTGVNPGFAMDYLAIVLSGVSQRVDAVEVHRIQDAGTRRLPLQRKIGAGMSAEAFHKEVEAKRLGHVGLTESVYALAAAFGWRLDRIADSIEPVICRAATPWANGMIAPGQVTGILQMAEGFESEAKRVSLTLNMAIGLGRSSDRVVLHGAPDLELVVPDGLHGDLATAAIVVNSIPRILEARPGLLVMADMAPPTPGPPW